MSAHHFLVAPLTSAANSVAEQAAITPLTMTSGRVWSTIAIVVGAAAVVVGIIALVRAGRVLATVDVERSRRSQSAWPSPSSAAPSSQPPGGPGTGYGIVGGFVSSRSPSSRSCSADWRWSIAAGPQMTWDELAGRIHRVDKLMGDGTHHDPGRNRPPAGRGLRLHRRPDALPERRDVAAVRVVSGAPGGDGRPSKRSATSPAPARP